MHRQPELLISLFLFSSFANSANIRIVNQYALTSESVTIDCLLPPHQSYQMFRLMREETSVFSIMNLPGRCPKVAGEQPAMKPSFSMGFSNHSITNNSVTIVLNARKMHSGHYKCLFMDGNNDYVSRQQNLTVGNLPYVRSLKVEPNIVIQGTLFKVKCLGSKGLSDGKIKIYSNNRIVEAQETVVTTIDGTSLTKVSAHLQAPKESKKETFTCRGTNILNEKRKDVAKKNEMTITVPIYHPPNIIEISPKKQYYKTGDTLTCIAKGHPIVNFKWLVKLNNPSKEVKQFVGKQLTLSKLAADPINIICIAENTIGYKKYVDRKIINLERRRDGFENINFHQSTATNATAKKDSSTASSTDAAKKTAAHHKTTKSTAEQLVSTPSLQSQTTQFGFMPMTASEESKSTTKKENVTVVVVPKRKLTKTDKRYENVILYLKLSISFNLIFGVAILFTLIGLCLRVSNFMK